MEDIPLLAEHILDRLARKLGRKRPRLTLANVQELQRYSWPGNVRELQHVLERACIIALDGRLQFDLPHDKPIQPSIESGASIPKIMTEAEIRELEKDNIQRALIASGGKIYGPHGAAELLGMKPTTLASRIKSIDVRH